MSIIPVVLLWGVSFARHISFNDNDSELHPIVSHMQEKRICAELCLSGLGGTGCGDDCFDITPQGLPLQLQSNATYGPVDTDSAVSTPRSTACPLLCENQLGDPLCNCEVDYSHTTPRKTTRVDFVKICGYFCVAFDYQIYGCQQCDLYKNFIQKSDGGAVSSRNVRIVSESVDWDAWCKDMCAEGDGGAACNCDLLPMSFKH